LAGLKTAIIIRNPLEVAYSMHKRSAISYALGLRLWETHNRRLLANAHPDKHQTYARRLLVTLTILLE
jgi:hypothetical protein